MKVFIGAVVLIGCVLAYGSAQSAKECGGPDGGLSCHGAKIVRNLVRRLARTGKTDDALKLFPGVEIVAAGDVEERERSLNEVTDEDRTMFGRFARYLQSHELKVNFGQMEVIADVAEARKKDKGGLGAIMMMGLMMGKLLAALGFGGVGLLALKALGVSMIALLLSAILGLKKLTEHGDHKGRHNDEHFEVHSEDHHGHEGGARKRRSADEETLASQMAYSGWAQFVQ
ncbi:AGAP012556-PA [Anopheles gambiae str. PEST]|uniref:AGAP012556-PA n=1 Tax=Anopheles gambiae TaxID=7165 RepID=A0NAG1_ANOGA|nr:AGAP012556-PA [Anopheles gambiae str. PEST]